MELENSTLLSILVGMAGILAELIFHNTLSSSVFGMVLCVVLALVILCCAYFALDGISYSMSAARKKEERRRREYDEKLYRLLNRRLSEQVKLEKAIFSRLAKGISIDGNLAGEQGVPFSAETLQELAGQIDRSTTKAAKMVARYGQKSQADTDKVLSDIRKDVLKSLDEIALEVKRLEDCLNGMNFSAGVNDMPDEDILSQELSESGEEVAPDLFEEGPIGEIAIEDVPVETMPESDADDSEEELSSDEIEALLMAAGVGGVEPEKVEEEMPLKEAAEGTDEGMDADAADISEDNPSDMDMAIELPAEVEALLADDASLLAEAEALLAENNITEDVLPEEHDLPGKDILLGQQEDSEPEEPEPVPEEAELEPEEPEPVSEEAELVPEGPEPVPEEAELEPEEPGPVPEEAEFVLGEPGPVPEEAELVPEEPEPVLEEAQADEEQKSAELTALDILRMKQEEKEKSKAEQATASDAVEQETAPGKESSETAVVGGDANKMMSPDDIAALIASMN